ncbi:MAG: ATP-grasp domain-containing protein [Thiohalocapsa sp.]
MSMLSRSVDRCTPALLNPRLEQVPARILNHDIMGCTAEGIRGNYLYSGRALGMTEPGDIIQLHPDLKPQWPFISAHYDRVGLSFTDQVIWNVEHRALVEYQYRTLSVFFFGAQEQAARPNRPWYWMVECINSKNNFVALAQELGVPTPKTQCYGDVAEIDETEIRRLRFPCYLKAAVSVSGVGIYRCADRTALCAALAHFGKGIPVQIQTEVPSDCFLNLQYKVHGNRLSRFLATEQVLEGTAHQGNRYPARAEPWDCVEPMALWLYEQGMQGVFAFDVAVVEKDGRADYLAIECNPRFNGASYPTAIAKKLGIGQWLARSFKTEHRNLAEIDLAGLEYDPATGRGIILVNWGPVLVGKLLILLAGPPQAQEHLARELHARL